VKRTVVLALCGVLIAACASAPASASSAPAWVEGWAASPHSSAAETSVPTFTNRTLRMIVRLHAGGTSVRVRLANTFGDRPVRFGRASVALRTAGAATGPARPVLFAGRPDATVATGAEISSDPVKLIVSAGQDLAVDLFLPVATGPATWHRSALQTSYLSTAGDHVGGAASAFPTGTGHWFFLDAVAVQTTTSPGTVVALGDSITDGSGSPANANQRWPDVLHDRLAARGGGYESVVDEGIAGNRVLSDDPRNGVSALNRLTRDVLVRRGLKHVILLEGVNDLRTVGHTYPADDIIAGYRKIIDRVHAKKAKIYGATLTPIEGSGRYTPAMEAQRQKLNTWIRTSGAFDGVVDFDVATRDPADPLRFRPEYDSGDHLHPNQAGYRAMGDAIDLNLFPRSLSR
jgi:lysophospholipase L1-like esterase